MAIYACRESINLIAIFDQKMLYMDILQKNETRCIA